jgi:hypothetical protein
MAVFEKVVHGNLKDVIQNTDMLLKEGKHKLDFRDEYSMTSQGMDVTVRIYQRYNVIPGNSTCITLLFQDNKDGDIKIVGLLAGDEYGIFGMDLGMGARTAQACEEKLNSMDGAS